MIQKKETGRASDRGSARRDQVSTFPIATVAYLATGRELLGGGTLRQAKLLRPRVAADVVNRPRLIRPLDRGLDRPLVLLSGPAGFGKTTLLGQWLATASVAAAWLTLDAGDDVGVFVTHLVGALQPYGPGAGRTVLGLLRRPGIVRPADLGAVLADELLELPDDVVVVLDDYQEIVDPGVHELLDALLRHPPPRLHLVLATRQDPPLPLARLRARGQLVELRAPDLRLTTAEAAAFLARGAADGLEASAVGLLVEHTEGWAAGLRLAALRLEHRSTPAEVVEEFAGREHADAMEYLLIDTLERQPLELQEFALRTAVVERLCAPLCDALLAVGTDGPTHPAGSSHKSEATGERLLVAAVRANLFLTPLDQPEEELSAPSVPPSAGAGATWYRYHQLFRTLLLRQLRARCGPAVEQELHACAGAWLAAAGLIEEGLHHLLAAGDFGGAASLVERHVHPLLEHDEWLTLNRWLDRLPVAMIQHRPALLLARAWVAQRRGEFDALPALLAATRTALGHPAFGLDGLAGSGESPASDPGRAALEGEIAALGGFLSLFDGDWQGVLSAARRALALLPETYYHARGGAAGIAAPAALAAEGADGALRCLEMLRPTSTRVADAAMAGALPGVGVAMILAGRHHDAARAGRTLVQTGQGSGSLAAHCWGEALLGVVHYEWNQLEAATGHLAAAAAARDHARFLPLRVSTHVLALSLQAQGRAAEADDVLDQFADLLLRAANLGELALVGVFRVHLALMRGEMAAVRRWLQSSTSLPEHWLATVVDFPPLTKAWARLSLAVELPSPKPALMAVLADIDQLVTTTERMHLTAPQVQALALRAMADDALGKTDVALDSLTRAIELGETGGLVRTFVDLGPRLSRLLGQLEAPRSSSTSAYLQRVLDACTGIVRTDGRVERADRPSLSPQPADRLVEPLTDREVEVLHRLHGQLLNKEIAADLQISPETVKRHAANIYAKLGVGDRRRAVRRAAELGLLRPH
jgi:LuxR family maltose regulon positive regulatory protein